MGVALLALGSAVACVDSSVPTGISYTNAQVLLTANVAPHNVTMAVGDSLPISFTATNLNGDTLVVPDSTPVVWRSSDVTRVTVDSTGMIRAIAPTLSSNEFVRIIGTWTYRAVTKADTTTVAVTDVAYPITKLKVMSLDSTRLGSGNSFVFSFVSVQAQEADGTPVSSIYLPLTTSPYNPVSPTTLIFSFTPSLRALINLRAVGPFWVKSAATIYGVPLADSIEYTGLYPYAATETIKQDAVTGALKIDSATTAEVVQPCGAVTFTNQAQVPIDIVFSDSTKAAGCVTGDQTGNIRNLGQNQTAYRKFPDAGTVDWTVKRSSDGATFPGTSGTVTMKEPPAAP